MGDKWLISRTSFSSTETQMKLDKIDMDIKKREHSDYTWSYEVAQRSLLSANKTDETTDKSRYTRCVCCVKTKPTWSMDDDNKVEASGRWT